MLLNCGVGEDSWESLGLDCKDIQPVHPEGDQSWIFIGRTDVEAETPILWPPDSKNWLIEKDPDAGKDWRQEEKGTTQDEMVEWHHQLNGQEFEQAPGAGDGQGSLASCSPWGHKESDTTEQLNWTVSFFPSRMSCLIPTLCLHSSTDNERQHEELATSEITQHSFYNLITTLVMFKKSVYRATVWWCSLQNPGISQLTRMSLLFTLCSQLC